MHLSLLFFFFNDTATTEIYTLSLHDALPISSSSASDSDSKVFTTCPVAGFTVAMAISSLPPRVGFGARKRRKDRKSTRLNSSHGYISYAVFCLKKKKYPRDAMCILSRGSDVC